MFLSRFLFLLSLLALLHSRASAFDNQVGAIFTSLGEARYTPDGGYARDLPLDLFVETYLNRFEFGLKPGILSLIRIPSEMKKVKSISPSVYFGYGVRLGRHWSFTPEIELGYRYYRETYSSYYSSYKSESVLFAPGGKFGFEAGHFKMAGGNALAYYFPIKQERNTYATTSSVGMVLFFQIGFLFDLPEQGQ